MSLFIKRKTKPSRRSVLPETQDNTVSDESEQLSRRPEKSRRTAFTLIEVLVALFVAVLAVSSTYKLLNQSRSILRSSSNKLDALNGARAGLEYLRTLDFDDSLLSTGSPHSLNRNGNIFSYEVTLYEGATNIKQITVKTEWESAVSGNTHDLELVTLLSSSLHSD
jgi:prepilin-type N-terminal cleavage/methylation domain-containing protein